METMSGNGSGGGGGGVGGADKKILSLQIKTDLFKDVKYYVTGALQPEAQQLLDHGGAVCSKFLFSNITHCVCGKNFDENDVNQATDLWEVPSVNENWIYASARLGRLACTKPYYPMANGLFSKIVGTIVQLSAVDRKRLFALITFNGGKVERDFSAKTTHLICGTANGNAYKKAIELNSEKLEVVTPDWLFECLKAQELVETHIFHPRLLVGVSSAAAAAAMYQQQKSSAVLSRNHSIENDNRSLSNILGMDFDEKKALSKEPSVDIGTETISKSTESMSINVKSGDDKKQPTESNVASQVKLNDAMSMQTNDVDLQQKMTIQSSQQVTNQMLSMAGQQQQPLPPPQQQQQQPSAPTSGVFTFSQDEQQTGDKRDTNVVQARGMGDASGKPMHPVTMPHPSRLQQNTCLPLASRMHTGESVDAVAANRCAYETVKPPVQLLERSLSEGQQQLQMTHAPTPNTTNNSNNAEMATQQFFRQQSNQSHQIITHMPSQQPQQIILGQNAINQVITQKPQMGNSTSTPQGQPHQQTIQNQQDPNKPIQIQTIPPPQQQQQQSQQQQQNQQQQQTGPPAQRLIFSQQQFQQLNPQQQQQLLSTQNHNVVIINQSGQQWTQSGKPNQTQITPQVSSHQVQNQFHILQHHQHQQQQQGIAQNQDLGQANANLANQPAMQKILQTQVNQQKMHSIQNQVVIPVSQQQQQQPPQQQQQQQQWTPKSPMQGQNIQNIQVQAMPGAMIQGQSPQQQQIQQGGNALGPPTIFRTARPQWQQVSGQPAPQRQLIHLDAQTHAHLQTLDPIARAEYLSKLQKRNVMLRQHVAIQNSNMMPGHRPAGTQHIIVRGQVPGGQMQWLQQQQRPILVRSAAPGLSPISQQQNAQTPPIPAQFAANDGNAPPQFQRMQLQAAQKPQQMVQGQPTKPLEAADGSGNIVLQTAHAQPQQQHQQQQQQQQQQQTAIQQQQIQGPSDGSNQIASAVQMNKTKTALANMLSNRLSSNNGGGNMPITPDPTNEPSAAGTLRLMTAQHNAALSTGVGGVAIQSQENQQRRTLSNITNNNAVPVAIVQPQIQTATAVAQPPQMPLAQSPSATIKAQPFANAATAAGRTQLPRPQFYGHNPNLKLPPDLFLLGCIFYIVEYDEIYEKALPQWKQLIQRHGGEIENLYGPRVTHVLCRTQRHGVVMQAIRDSKRCVTAYWLNDTMIKKQVMPPCQALHLPMPSTFGTQRPATKYIIATSGFEGDERIRIKQMVEESGALFTEYFSRHNSVLICKKPEGNKYKRAKDWNIPVVNTVWLSDILQGNLSQLQQFDLQKYQQYNLNGPFRIDYALVSHLMTAWKSPINLTQESHERVKRMLSEPSPEPKPKKLRTYPPLEEIPSKVVCTETPDPSQRPRILFSQVDNIEGLKYAVTTLGGVVVTEPAAATHIVLTRLTRTSKLLLALCVVDHILSSKWIVESAKAGKFLPSDDFQLNDEHFSEIYRCDIQSTIKSTKRKQLFDGKTFYITPSVRPNVKELSALIVMSGGKVEKKRRTAAAIAETNAQQPESYIILTCTKDMHLLIDLTKPGKPNRIICATELVMTAVMQQKIEVEPHIITYF